MKKMETWLIFSILALITWGFWGFFPKLASMHINAQSASFYEVIGALIFGIIILFIMGFKIQTNLSGVTYAILAGFTALLGGLFLLYAFSSGSKVSSAIIITALYPIITILLSFFILHETISIKEGIAMILAIIAIVLFSI
jgi:bacterial/archaeal transporter family protein